MNKELPNVVDWEELGRRWLRGETTLEGLGEVKFNLKQLEFVNAKERYNLVAGGMASGKTLGFISKFILLHLFFPGIPSLIGRKTLQNAVSTFMKDFMEVCPPDIYEYKVGEHKIYFSNGSTATFFGLDALQGDTGDDLKKAVQNLKSHNFGLIFIDQLEEIELKVFEALNSRLRWRPCKHGKDAQKVFYDKKNQPVYEVCSTCGKYTFQQMNMAMNPANHWSYDFFKTNPRQLTKLTMTSMMDNKEHLSEQFILSEMQKPKLYVDRFVHGIWDDSTLVEGSVFYEEWIKEQRMYMKKPIREFDGIRIYKEPTTHTYQIGVDPSMGATDPCGIKCVDTETGELVASYKGFVPINVQVEKTVQIALMYSLSKKPLVIPEATGVGQAFVEEIKKVYEKIYEREVFSQREKKETKKLGFYTNFQTKTQLIENMKNLFQKHFPKIYDEEVVSEMVKFIYSDQAQMLGAGAQNGFHDDQIMSTMLAFWNVAPVTLREKNILDRMNGQKKSKVVKYIYD